MRKRNGFAQPSPHPSPTSGRGSKILFSFPSGAEKKQKFPSPSGRGQGEGGFVLLLSIVIMIVLSAIISGLIVALTADMRNLAVQRNDAKAFWIAEAGVADAVKRLKNSEITVSVGATNNTISNVSFGGGSYSVTLTRPVSDVVIVSTGTYNSQTRQLTQSETVTTLFPLAFDYAVFGSNSTNATLKIGNNNAATVTVSGDLYFKGGSLPNTDIVDVKTLSKVTGGLVYADSIMGSGTYTAGVGDPSPLPPYPTFSTTTYDNAITTADATASANLTVSGATNLNLAGATVYYKTVTIKDTATITGPGTIVATKAVSIQDSANVGQTVNFIGKANITVQNSAIIQTGGSVYSRGTIILKDSASVVSLLLAPVSGEQIRVQNTATFQGALFSDMANIQDSAIVNGSIVVNKFASNQIANNATVTFNSSYIPSTVPTSFSGVRYTYAKLANSWAEV